MTTLKNHVNCLYQQLSDKMTEIEALKIQHSIEIKAIKQYYEKIISDLKKQYKPVHEFIDEEMIYKNIAGSDKPNFHWFPKKEKDWGKSDTDMITITFDPSKFDMTTDEEDLRNYILTACSKAIEEDIVYNFYGCFEKHKSGALHAHVLYKTNKTKSKVYRFFKPLFTDNKTNNIAVKISEDIINCDYINKESKDYFWSTRQCPYVHINDDPLDYGVILTKF